MVNAEFISEDGLVTRAKVIHNFLVFSRATEYDVISAFSLKKKRGPTDDDFKELFIHTLHSLKPKVLIQMATRISGRCKART